MKKCQVDIPVPDLNSVTEGILFLPGNGESRENESVSYPAYLHIPGTDFLRGYEPDEDDGICEDICRRLGAVVFMPLWKGGVQAAFPSAHEQCYAAALWFFARANEYGVDAAHVTVGGSGAGGNLAAGLVLRAKAAGEFTSSALVLAAAPLDLRKAVLKKDSAEKLYIGRNIQYALSPYVSPVCSSDAMLTELPSILMLLSDDEASAKEGAEFAVRMASNGTEVSAQRLPHHNVRNKGYADFRKAAVAPVLQFLSEQNARIPGTGEFRSGAAGMAAVEG